jgi:hypothetical protein
MRSRGTPRAPRVLWGTRGRQNICPPVGRTHELALHPRAGTARGHFRGGVPRPADPGYQPGHPYGCVDRHSRRKRAALRRCLHPPSKRQPWAAHNACPHNVSWPPSISPASKIVWRGARHRRVVTNAVRSPVRPATWWICVVSMASASVIAGSMVVSHRASIDLPALGGRES